MSLDIKLIVFDENITHNLNTMAKQANLYQVMWRPEELGIEKAEEAVGLLEKGLKELKANPDKFKAFNPKNGWGTYEQLVSFVKKYLAACRKFPSAIIDISR